MSVPTLHELVSGIKDGDKRLLGKGITLIESTKSDHQELAQKLLAEIMPFTGNSIRIGVTGVPGAGKSTFIENFGQLAIQKGKKVAVLAIDPSSSISKGSIMGDKTRMENLAKEDRAFIRPSPSSGFLGGVANTTFETMLLCEAAGYDYILIETVGVGQSETLVADITDVFLFLKIIGTGDELQGIKRGIMEMVDLVFINKVNDENIAKAKLTRVELLRALQFLPPKVAGWRPPVILGSALGNVGLESVFEKIDDFTSLRKTSGNFEASRKAQAERRFDYWVQELIMQRTREMQQQQENYLRHRQNSGLLRANPSQEARLFVEGLFRR